MNSIHVNKDKRFISIGAATLVRLMPQGYPFVLLDRVVACYAEEGIGHSIKAITMTDPVLNGHFAQYPIYPGVLIIEALIQNSGMIAMVRDLLRHHGSYEAVLDHFAGSGPIMSDQAKQYFLAESRVKHTAPIYPGELVELQSKLILERDGLMVFKIGASVSGREVANGQATMAVSLAAGVKALAG
jgi:3-hydroxyacyl-[acyl-carrier-protein] dehydratase